MKQNFYSLQNASPIHCLQLLMTSRFSGDNLTQKNTDLMAQINFNYTSELIIEIIHNDGNEFPF